VLHFKVDFKNRWTVLSTTRTGTIAFDSATVSRRGQRIFEAWLRIDADSDDSVQTASYKRIPYSHVLTRYGFDCGRRRLASRGSTYYDSTGAVLNRTEDDSLRWQLALPESRGEEFLREFCLAIDGARPPRSWIVAAKPGDNFSPKSVSIRATDSLLLSSGMPSSHTIGIDTARLSPVQSKAARAFNELPLFLRSLAAIGEELKMPSLPPGTYRVYCANHMIHSFEYLLVEVRPTAPRPGNRQQAPASTRPPTAARP